MEGQRRGKPLTREELEAALAGLVAQGEIVTPTKLYSALGGRGSFSTISRFLKNQEQGGSTGQTSADAAPVLAMEAMPEAVRGRIRHVFEQHLDSAALALWLELQRALRSEEVAAEVALLETEVERLRGEGDDRDRLRAELSVAKEQLAESRFTAEARLAELSTAHAQRESAVSALNEAYATARALRAETEAALLARANLERRLQRQEEALQAATLALAARVQRPEAELGGASVREG